MKTVGARHTLQLWVVTVILLGFCDFTYGQLAGRTALRGYMSEQATIGGELERLRGVLQREQEELVRLLEQRAALDVTIHELQNNIRHLARMCDVVEKMTRSSSSASPTIRYVIGNYGKPITPVEVRDQLLRWYCKHDDYRNLLASVHTVMKRVERAGEITFDGTRAVWTGGPPPPPLIGYFPSRRNFHKQ